MNQSTKPLKPVSVIIPTLQAEGTLPELLAQLKAQTCPVTEIIVVDSSSKDRTGEIAAEAGCLVQFINREDFSHGAARNLGARLARGDILVFLTQDVVPVNNVFLENLIAPVAAGKAAASSARQVAGDSASPLEKYARIHNYPSESQVCTVESIRKKDKPCFLFSNAASALDAEVFLGLGGFSENLIVNEDMQIFNRLMNAGYSAAYQAEAVVEHTHNYGTVDIFRRYFDIGIFFSQAGDEPGRFSIAGNGIRYALGELFYLFKQGKWGWIPVSAFLSLDKYLAFRLGLCWRNLPDRLAQKLSRHPMVLRRLQKNKTLSEHGGPETDPDGAGRSNDPAHFEEQRR
ncbi:MAG: glycosyltransferase [Anaerolineales bacterium]|nr:glycosyltransferase [Anaerolineales bacterium]